MRRWENHLLNIFKEKIVFEYTTIQNLESPFLYKEKGSKFIGYAFQIEDKKEVETHLQEIKKEHPLARHICYGYLLKDSYRAYDDGEPNGTAGLPIYNQILSFGLNHVLVVVVRYFGGTKLGVSGLISAYKNTAKNTLAQCEKVQVEISFRLRIQCQYQNLSLLFAFLQNSQGKIQRQTLDETCQFWVDFPLKSKADVIDKISQYNFGFEEI
ncbi:MAG: hypothetical protein C4K58_03425 [Flavobacteriaceae bacterium]|nr:MAG: hypothetical protein C4K58_03425 [Flavobacteriaceae bacterium]